MRQMRGESGGEANAWARLALCLAVAMVAMLGAACGDQHVVPDEDVGLGGDVVDELDVSESEELPESVESDAEAQVEVPVREQLAMVAHAGDEEHSSVYLVLETLPEADWFADEPQFLGYEAARAAVVADEIPAGLAAWDGRDVELFDADGAACPGQVVGLFGLARALPAYGMIAQWDGELSFDGTPATPLSRPEIARELWKLSNGPSLVAQVEAADGCEASEAVWARADGADVEPLASVELGEAEEQMLVAAMRSEQRYADHQQRMLDSGYEHDGTWSTYRGASPRVKAFRSEASGRTYAAVFASVGEGCGGFNASMSSLYEIGGEAPQLLDLSDDEAYIVPKVMVDVGPDKTPVIIGRNHAGVRSGLLVEQVGDTHRILQEHVVPFYGCGC